MFLNCQQTLFHICTQGTILSAQGMRSPLLPEFVSSILIHNHVTVLERVVCVFVMFCSCINPCPAES